MAKKQKKGDFWSNLGAGGYGALNSLLLGLPDFLVQNVGGSKAYEDLDKWKKENETGSNIGNIAGTVGSFLIPGGAIAKGVGMGAKALTGGKVGSKLVGIGDELGKTGGTLSQQIKRGFGTGLEQAAVRNALDVSRDEEGEQKDLGERLGGTLMGGAFGAGGGALGSQISKLLGGKTLTHAGNKLTGDIQDSTIASGLGVNKRVLSSALRERALAEGIPEDKIDDYIRSNLETVKPKLYDLVTKQGIRGEGKIDELLDNPNATLDPLTKSILTKARIADEAGVQGKNLMSNLGTAGLGAATVGGTSFANEIGKNDGDVMDALGKSLPMAAGGFLAGKAAPALLSKVGQRAAESPKVAEMLGKLGGVSKKLDESTILGQKAGTVLEQLPAKAGGVLGSDTAKPVEDIKTPEEAAQIAKERLFTSPEYRAKIDKSLTDTYNRWYSDMTPEEFLALAREKTNNFDPSNIETGRLLFGFDPEAAQKFNQDYQTLTKVLSYDAERANKFSIPFMGDNKEDKALKEALTEALSKDFTDRDAAKKKAAQYVQKLKEGTVSMDELKEFLMKEKFKTLGQVGIA